MAYGIEIDRAGRFHWYVVHTAYGAAAGSCDSLAAAKVELAIGEAAVFETPYPPAVVAVMRSDYERFAADWSDPDEIPPYRHEEPEVST